MKLRGPLVVVDLETTGMDCDRDEIIEIGAVKMENGVVTGTFQRLIRPVGEIPPFIQELTGITPEMVRDAPALAEVLKEFREFWGDVPLFAHNADFDGAFLRQALKRPDLTLFCTLELSQLLLPQAPGYGLNVLSKQYSLQLEDHHRALSDALATARLVQVLAEEYLRLLPELGGLWRQQAKSLGTRLEAFFHWMELPPAPPFKLRPKALPLDGGLFAVGGERRESLFAKVQELASLLGEEGPFCAKVPGFSPRPQQIRMLEKVDEAFREDALTVIEGATGTGKSLAYLLPALKWAAAREEKVVVATHTITLQDQLWNKDLPLIEEVMGEPVRRALVKGRSNYLCLRKLRHWLDSPVAKSPQETLFAVRLAAWAIQSERGDKQEIVLRRGENYGWNRFSADSESCLGPRCSYFREQCYVTRMRRWAQEADLLVINHSLLFSDLKTENRVLPEFDRLIIDEAHHLEDGATDHLGERMAQGETLSFLGQMDRSLLEPLERRLKPIAQYEGMKTVRDILDRFFPLREALSQARQTLEIWFGLLGGGEERTRRIRPGDWSQGWWQEIILQGENAAFHLRECAKHLVKMASSLEALDEGEGEWAEEARDLAGGIRFLQERIDFLEALPGLSDDVVIWIESGGGEYPSASLQWAPIHVGRILADQLFSRKKTVVLTSATLSVAGDFAPFVGRIGLTGEWEPRTLTAESPFAYDRQVYFTVVRDLPSPLGVDDEGFGEAIAPYLAELARLMEGYTMVLFTSNRLLQAVYRRLKELLRADGIRVLGQGIDGGQRALLEMFEGRNTVLLGTNSFWEGVDLPEDRLRCLVIPKLPFSPPTAPTVEARMEKLAEEGRDGFREYLLPLAVIRMKQGFGRLIRRQGDYGCVVVLDRRMIEKSYGRSFIRSLPLPPVATSRDSSLEGIVQFFGGFGAKEQVTI